ncbi:MAG: GGDEF domain-containing protein [Oscillospiraceae bacterium]|jgi:EAL domain-containing protein (putative c-di-GMP-specific phosphodiesterase class I)/GGDEF domain-containing protein|nr:GGDEF domain-containing protein [Oscillospiraceae bacterium]
MMPEKTSSLIKKPKAINLIVIRMIVILSCLIGFTLATMGAFSLYLTADRSELEKSADDDASALKIYFDSLLSTVKVSASMLSLVPDLETNADKTYEILTDIRVGSSFTAVDFVSVAEADGRIKSVPNIFINSDIPGDGPDFVFTVPVYNESDEIKGFLRCAVNSSALSNKLALLHGRSDTMFIIDKNDIVIAANTRAQLLDSLGNHIKSASVIDGVKYDLIYSPIGISDWECVFTFNNSLLVPLHSHVGILVVSGFALLFLAFCGVMLGLIEKIGHNTTYSSIVRNEYDRLINADSLTTACSERRFRELLKPHSVADGEPPLIVCLLDIKDFRSVNLAFGYDTGNVVISKIGEIIERNLNKKDKNEFYTRVYADKFYISMYCEEEEVEQRIADIFNEIYYQITECRLVVTAGIYIANDPNADPRFIMDCANFAKLQVSDSVENSMAFFDPGVLKRIRVDLDIENIMEQALESGEFITYFQPKYFLKNRDKISGAEALVRWKREGMIRYPGTFIPIFERNGFIGKLDFYLFDHICRMQKKFLDNATLKLNRDILRNTNLSAEPIYANIPVVSVNMSRVNILKEDFVEHLFEICTKYALPTRYIEIEITESASFVSNERILRCFGELHAKGFSVSIDDFGTGYSSLSMLKDLPVDVLKIDRAFLSDIDFDRKSVDVMEAIISLAEKLDIRTICEGLETLEQVDLLTELGCREAQGFYFSRPIPAEEYEELIMKKYETVLVNI